MPLSTKIYAAIEAIQTGTAGLGNVTNTIQAVSKITELPSGTGAGQADVLYSSRRTLAASGTENIDLAGALTDVFGATITFAKVKALQVTAAAGNTNNVVVGGAASNFFVGPFGGTTPTISVPPGGTMVLAAPVNGWAVTAATADLLKILNSGSGTSVTYDITVVGTSA